MNSKELAILMSGSGIVASLFIMVGAITLEGYKPTITKLKLAAPFKSIKKDGFAQSPIYLIKNASMTEGQ
ncbi:hypothetical protein B1F79_05180 [Coxiella-like endosymbiont of Rhipicephalus sanguineus]|nr:hypothetical protein [Coxiella-like endosymbiont of Rhipicephalus sanguineus]